MKMRKLIMITILLMAAIGMGGSAVAFAQDVTIVNWWTEDYIDID